MGKLPVPIKVILLSIKPLSKTTDVWDLRDIISSLLILVGYGGGGIMIQELVSLDWIRISYFAFVPALLLFIAAIKLQRSVDDHESKLPSIIFGVGGVATGKIYEIAGFTPLDSEIDRSKPIGDFHMVYVFVKNDPSGHRTREKTAEKAAPIIDIYEPTNLRVPFKSYWGKWRDKPLASSRPHNAPITDLMELDLPPNGIPHRIDFALKYHADEDMYGYNDEAHRYSSDGRFAEFKLPSNNFLVKVRLKAIGLKDEPTWWYEISHQGKESEPIIRQLSKDEIMRLGC